MFSWFSLNVYTHGNGENIYIAKYNIILAILYFAIGMFWIETEFPLFLPGNKYVPYLNYSNIYVEIIILLEDNIV